MPTLQDLSPPLWFTLHTFSGSFPENPSEDEKDAAVDFVQSLTHLMPCPRCKKHLVQFLKKKPVEDFVDSGASFERWMYDYHEDVNDVSKVPKEKRSSFEDVKKAFRPGPWKNLVPGYWFIGGAGEGPYEKFPAGTWLTDKDGNLQLNKPYFNTICDGHSRKNSVIVVLIVVLVVIVVVAAALAIGMFALGRRTTTK